MKKQKNLRMDDYTIFRIENLAEELKVSEATIIQQATIMMSQVFTGETENYGVETLEDLKQYFIYKFQAIRGEL